MAFATPHSLRARYETISLGNMLDSERPSDVCAVLGNPGNPRDAPVWDSPRNAFFFQRIVLTIVQAQASVAEKEEPLPNL